MPKSGTIVLITDIDQNSLALLSQTEAIQGGRKHNVQKWCSDNFYFALLGLNQIA
jgi:hypothetical protein